MWVCWTSAQGVHCCCLLVRLKRGVQMCKLFLAKLCGTGIKPRVVGISQIDCTKGRYIPMHMKFSQFPAICTLEHEIPFLRQFMKKVWGAIRFGDNTGMVRYCCCLNAGGSVTAGLGIYDTMQYVRPPVATWCVGQACSMGAFLLAAGQSGLRHSLPNSRVMIHQPHGATGVST